jgi:hypothetical protein
VPKPKKARQPQKLYSPLAHSNSNQSKYFSLTGRNVDPVPGKRLTNQNTPKTQMKIATRLELSIAFLPKYMYDYINDVKKNGKADLLGLGLDICHITAIDKMKETLASGLSNREHLTDEEMQAFAHTIEDTLSSDDEDGRVVNRKKTVTMLNPKTDIKVAMRFADQVLERLNRSSRNLRPGYNGPNRGIGNDKDPFVIKEKEKEEDRSLGISNYWNKMRRILGLAKDTPISKDINGQTMFKSSSVDRNPDKSFTAINGVFNLEQKIKARLSLRAQKDRLARNTKLQPD